MCLFLLHKKEAKGMNITLNIGQSLYVIPHLLRDLI